MGVQILSSTITQGLKITDEKVLPLLITSAKFNGLTFKSSWIRTVTVLLCCKYYGMLKNPPTVCKEKEVILLVLWSDLIPSTKSCQLGLMSHKSLWGMSLQMQKQP